MNLLFYWKRRRLEIFNPVTIDNPEMILNVKLSSDLPFLPSRVLVALRCDLTSMTCDVTFFAKTLPVAVRVDKNLACLSSLLLLLFRRLTNSLIKCQEPIWAPANVHYNMNK